MSWNALLLIAVLPNDSESGSSGSDSNRTPADSQPNNHVAPDSPSGDPLQIAKSVPIQPDANAATQPQRYKRRVRRLPKKSTQNSASTISDSRVLFSSQLSLNKVERALHGYSDVLALMASDAEFQKDVTLGKRIGFYKVGKELGAGNFSKVKLGLHMLTKEKVAIKVMEKSRMDPKAQKLLEREVQNMEQMHHPNIVRLFEVLETLSKVYLVLEYAGGGEVYGRVLEKGRMRETEAKRIFGQILSAVIHMHEKLIIHRDIKAENVFFCSPTWVKLGDFGFSVQVEPGQSLNTFCGSPPYAAPELFKDANYLGEYVDIWALGVLLHFMVTGNTPFRGETVAELKRQILDGYFTIPVYVSPFCQDLINGILQMRPTSRLTLNDIEEHYWMSSTQFPEAYTRMSLIPNEEEFHKFPLIAKVRMEMHKYGITDQMMKEAAEKGAKHSIIGMYRILICQHQQHEIHSAREQLQLDIVSGQHPVANRNMNHKKISRLCAIL